MITRTRALFWSVVSLGIGALAYFLAVGSTVGQNTENSLLDASDFTVNPPAPLNLVSNMTVFGALALVSIIALWVHGIGRLLSVLFASGIALVSSQVLKESWLERPELVDFVTPNSFPSGHMTVFSVISAGLIWALPGRYRVLSAALAAVLLSTVSWQLLEFGWHRPSDVIGAQALTVCTFSLVSWIGPRGSKQAATTANTGRDGLNRMFGIILTLIGIVTVFGGLALIAASNSLSNDSLMLNAWETLLVGVSILSARTLAKVCP